MMPRMLWLVSLSAALWDAWELLRSSVQQSRAYLTLRCTTRFFPKRKGIVCWRSCRPKSGARCAPSLLPPCRPHVRYTRWEASLAAAHFCPLRANPWERAATSRRVEGTPGADARRARLHPHSSLRSAAQSPGFLHSLRVGGRGRFRCASQAAAHDALPGPCGRPRNASRERPSAPDKSTKQVGLPSTKLVLSLTRHHESRNPDAQSALLRSLSRGICCQFQNPGQTSIRRVSRTFARPVRRRTKRQYDTRRSVVSRWETPK